jgi:hypothetical protein
MTLDPMALVDSSFPVQFVKIIPLAAWGNSFNFSIWHIELRGDDSPLSIAEISHHYSSHLQRESWRLCLKFLREQAGMDEIFQALQQQTGVQLEDPLVSQLFDLIVRKVVLYENSFIFMV